MRVFVPVVVLSFRKDSTVKDKRVAEDLRRTGLSLLDSEDIRQPHSLDLPSPHHHHRKARVQYHPSPLLQLKSVAFFHPNHQKYFT